MIEYKLSEDSARENLLLFKTFYDICIEDVDSDSARYHAMRQNENKLIRAIRKGQIEIAESDEGIIVKQYRQFAESDNKTLIYGVLQGKHKRAMDKAGDGQYARIYALLGSLSGWGSAGIEKLKGVDNANAEALGLLFLEV
jgi:hypothetical protein